MIALGPKRSLAAEQLVQLAGDANLETSNATSDLALVRRFDDEVQMVVLDREMDDLKPLPLGELMPLAEKSGCHDF